MRLVDLFDNSLLYQGLQSCISKKHTSEFLQTKILKPIGVKKVLDFGCGIGSHSIFFPNSHQLGLEPLDSCVARANSFFKRTNTNFLLADHTYLKNIPDSSFDLVIAMGVLHHVNDSIFQYFVRQSHRILKPGGRLTTLDPVLHPDQSSFSKWVVKRDRGRWVRDRHLYTDLFINSFNNELTIEIYKGLLRIPYDHIHIEAFKEDVTYPNKD